MTPSMPLSAPRTLHAAVGFAFLSMTAAFGQSMLLLVVRSFFDPSNADAWENEGEDFHMIVIVAMVMSTVVAIIMAVSAVMTMVLRNNVGRILLFVAAPIAVIVNMGCSCIFNMAWLAGADTSDPSSGAEHYQSWQFTCAVLLGYLAAIAAIVCVILLAQRSVNQYYRALRQGWA